MDYRKIYDENYFNGKNSFFYRFGYGRFNQKYFNKIFKSILPYLDTNQEQKILDVGCAYGFMLEKFPENFEKYGVDVSAHAIEKAKNRLPQASFTVCEAEKELPFPDTFFDIVICNDVIEHLRHPEKALKNINGKLKKDGLLYLTTPNLNLTRKKIFFKLDEKEHHVSLFSKKELIELLQKNGFEVLDSWTYINGTSSVSIKFKSNIGTESAFICRKI